MKFNTLLGTIGKHVAGYAGKSDEPAPPPSLGSPKRFPYGPFQLTTQARSGVQYEILASTNLEAWQSISTGTGTGQPVEYVDSEASKYSCRFYRVVTPESHSVKLIGYISVTLPPGFSMIANPLITPRHTVAELFEGFPEGTTLYKYDTRAFALMANAIKGKTWARPAEELLPGEGGILFNPTSDYRTLNFIGEVMQGSSLRPIPSGYSIRSSLLPRPGRVHHDLGFPISEGDNIHLFDRDKQEYVIHYYDAQKWESNPPVVGVGEAFWVAKKDPGNWRQQFTLA